MNRVRMAGLLASGLALAAPGGMPAMAGETGNAVIVIDGSRFMGATMAGQRKVELARRAVETVLPDYAGRLNAGILAYGHSKARACNDIAVLARVGPIVAEEVRSALEAVKSSGARGTSRALARAAELLADVEGERAIVLMTDGQDSCRANPCETARELVAANPGLRVHLIAVGAEPQSLDAIACVGALGGGETVDAQSFEDLENGLRLVLDQVTGRDRGAEAAAKAPTGLWLSASLAAGGAPITEGVRWQVSRAGETVYEGNDPEPRVGLPPGRYTVTATLGTVTRTADVDVASEGATRLALALDAGRLQLRALANGGGTPLKDVFMTVYRVDPVTGKAVATVAVSKDALPRLLLAPGAYRVLLEHGLAKVERSYTLAAGSEVLDDVVVPVGELVLEARAAGSGEVLERVLFSISEDDPDQPGGVRLIARSAASRPSFTLRAGVYHVHARVGEVQQTTDVSVQAGTTTAQVIEIGSGRLRLSARAAESGEPLSDDLTYVVERLEPDRATVLRTARVAPQFDLAPGIYRISCRFGAVNAVGVVDVELKSGASGDVVIDVPSAKIRFKAGAVAADTFWDLSSLDGEWLWSTAMQEPEVTLAPGQYRMTVTHRGGKRGIEFTVAAGESRTIEIPSE
jgi:Ca-activated chloride channel family protein